MTATEPTTEDRLRERVRELQRSVDRLAMHPSELRHALGHVVDCDDGCHQCIELSREALRHCSDTEAEEIVAERDRFRAALEAIAEPDELTKAAPAFALFAYRHRREQALWALGRLEDSSGDG